MTCKRLPNPSLEEHKFVFETGSMLSCVYSNIFDITSLYKKESLIIKLQKVYFFKSVQAIKFQKLSTFCLHLRNFYDNELKKSFVSLKTFFAI